MTGTYFDTVVKIEVWGADSKIMDGCKDICELYGRYRLEQDQEIDVNDKNKVLIKDGKVRMEDADCPDQICVNHRAISRDGESIICLPNQTVVTIRGGEEPEVDEIAR